MSRLYRLVHAVGRDRSQRALWALVALACWLWAGYLIKVTWLRPRTDVVWERVLQSGIIRVAMDATYPPFNIIDAAGNWSGYDVDLVNELASRWGVRAEFVNIHFDGLYDALLANKCDMICSALPYDPTLTKDVLYSPSYFNAGLVIVVRDSERGIRTANDLSRKTVGVEMATSGHLQARWLLEQARIPLEIRTYATSTEALQALRDEHIDAVIVESVAAYGFAHDPGGVVLTEGFLTDEQYVIAMPPYGGYLWKRIADDLAALKREGFFRELQLKWF